MWASTAWLALDVLLERVSHLDEEEPSERVPRGGNAHQVTAQQNKDGVGELEMLRGHAPSAPATHIMSFWSSATEPNRDSWSRCHETSSTTAVCPVKMVLASTTFPSFVPVPMSHRQMV